MRGLLIRWAVSAAALWLTAQVVRGVAIRGLRPLLFAALTICVLNAFVRPIVILLTLPLTVVTLGLFILVVNAAMFYLASDVVRGFEVRSFGAAFAGWLLFSVFSFLINLLIGSHGDITVISSQEIVRF